MGFLLGWLGFSHVNSTGHLQQSCLSLFFHKYCTRGNPRTSHTHTHKILAGDIFSGFLVSIFFFFLPSPDYQPLQALGLRFRWQTGMASKRKKGRQMVHLLKSSSVPPCSPSHPSRNQKEHVTPPCTPIQGYWHVLNWEDMTYVNLPKGKSAPSIFLSKNK